MYSKNQLQFLANKFNKKKTIQNDINRIQNIHKKSNHSFTIVLPPYKIIHRQESEETGNTEQIDKTTNIYKFNNNYSSDFIKFDVSRENYNDNDNIPKILFKDVPIPSYYETDKFDLNKINSNISTPIHMDIFIGDIIQDGDISRLKKKNIYKIIHVYQEKYASGVFPTGLGDFIRSCFFIIQFCNKYNFQYEIIINHPIANFLNKFYLPNAFNSNILNNRVFKFSETNWAESVFDNQNYIEKFLLIKQKFNQYVDYLCSLPVVNHSVFSYNILFPYDQISTEECDVIRSIFEPSREISEKIDEILDSLELTKNEYIIFHVRSGDSYLKGENKIFNSLYFEIIKNEIIEIIFKNKDINILLIADNNEIKIILHEYFPFIKYLIYDITHIGEGIQLDIDKVKNTMIDFYLIANSSSIFSFTSYPHGSGFSYWCSKIFNIPYKCKYINVK
jgi:hypothetical protein